MPVFFIYLIKLSVSLSVVFLFYHFVLRKLTFYNHNRWYLLAYTVLSFLIPFINISSVLEKNNWNTNDVINWVPVIQTSTTSALPIHTGSEFNIWSTVILVLIAGICMLLFRLLLQLLSFRRMLKKAMPVTTEGMNLYQVNENIIPFSFGNSIFINRHLHNEKELEEIIRHEFVHVKQGHSFDIIWAEILCLLNWFNPFAWLLKRSIRQNLEFIADNKVLEKGANKKEYQYLLLKVIGNNQYSIATQFNFSSLKKRIAMMNKLRSAKLQLLKFLFLLPVAVVMLLAFRSKYENTQQHALRITGNNLQDTVPAIKKEGRKIPEEISSIGLFQNQEEAGSADPVKQKLQGLVLVKRKDGGKEIYDLDSKENMDAFEKKYGVKLEDVLPAPPPPPLPAKGVNLAAPVAPVAPVRAAQTISSTTPMAETNGEEINLSGISNEYEITDKKAVIKLKNGTTEKYDLTNKQERSAFEKKYGKIIHVNSNINTSINSDINSTISTTITPAVVVTATPSASVSTSVSAVIAPATIRSASSVSTTITSTTPRPDSSVAVVDDYGYVITGKEDIVITITKTTTRQQLDDFVKQMKAKDIELTYDNIEYNSDGQLTSISGSMKSGDSHSNFVASDFNKLILAMIKKGDRTYFKVSTRDNKEVI